MTEYRRGTANSYVTTIGGRRVKLIPDENGVIECKTKAERQAADAFGLPITKLPKLPADEVAALKKKGGK